MTTQKLDMESIVREAVAFHGHLGPFLVVGLRMGLIGLRELKTSGSDFDLQAIAILKQTTPFSCAIDGIEGSGVGGDAGRRVERKRGGRRHRREFLRG